MITTNQMELGFEQQEFLPSASLRNRRHARAEWWFRQMRHVVDLAMEWRPKPPGRPQQSYLVLNAR